MNIKYPDVVVPLSGEDGNVFSIIGRVSRAIRKNHGETAAKEFSDAALQSGSYDEVLVLCQQMVVCE